MSQSKFGAGVVHTDDLGHLSAYPEWIGASATTRPTLADRPEARHTEKVASTPERDRGRLRASDADRDRVAAVLRQHCSAGRLTFDELSERLEQAYHARTLVQLFSLTNDLPDP